MSMQDIQHVFIIGAKGIPGSYGGYETFVDKLTECHENVNLIKYHVACKANGRGVAPDMKKRSDRFSYHHADCFKVNVPSIGAAEAVFYDCRAFNLCIKYIQMHDIKHPIVYVLACRIGPFVGKYKKQLAKLGGKMYLNPDGHEWKRAKWSKFIRWYWKKSEQLMIKHADLVVCDSKNIEQYVKRSYLQYKPKTTYIAYGAETDKSVLTDNSSKLCNWYNEWNLVKGRYYLIVGRFVPENNFETMIREFMMTKIKRDLVIITTKDDKFLHKLDSKLGFSIDSRIKFVGTVYDRELLKKIRENAYGYLHGHEVGGTNPSLLEALGSTKLNLLLDVGFNRECGEDGAIYWTKETGNLATLLENADKLNDDKIDELAKKAKERIKNAYSWQFIADEYKNIFRSDDK